MKEAKVRIWLWGQFTGSSALLSGRNCRKSIHRRTYTSTNTASPRMDRLQPSPTPVTQLRQQYRRHPFQSKRLIVGLFRRTSEYRHENVTHLNACHFGVKLHNGERCAQYGAAIKSDQFYLLIQFIYLFISGYLLLLLLLLLYL
jgi:hypothetical protein